MHAHMHTHTQTGASLTYHHDIKLKAFPKRLPPDLLLYRVKADVALQLGLH